MPQVPAGPEILDEEMSSPALATGGGNAGMQGPHAPAPADAPARPVASASEHSEGEAAAAFAANNSNQGPSSTHSIDELEQAFHDAARSNQSDTNDDEPQTDPQDHEALKKEVLEVLSSVKKQAGVLEQLKDQVPDAYQAVVQCISTMTQLYRELANRQGTTDHKKLGKNEQPVTVDPKVHDRLVKMRARRGMCVNCGKEPTAPRSLRCPSCKPTLTKGDVIDMRTASPRKYPRQCPAPDGAFHGAPPRHVPAAGCPMCNGTGVHPDDFDLIENWVKPPRWTPEELQRDSTRAAWLHNGPKVIDGGKPPLNKGDVHEMQLPHQAWLGTWDKLNPEIIGKLSRESAIRMLQFNDPNGVYDDEGSHREGFDPLTEEEARSTLLEQWHDSQPSPPPPPTNVVPFHPKR